MNRWARLCASIAIIMLVVAGGYWALRASQAHNNTITQNQSHGGLDYTNGNDESLLPESNSKVRIHAWLSTNTESPIVFIKLLIAKGWHVNANPPSLGFLIPTVVRIKVDGQDAAAQVESYPKGSASHIRLDHTAIRVYSSGTTLRAHLTQATLKRARATGSLVVIVQLQACSNRGICLPPANIRSVVPISSSTTTSSN